MALTRYTTPEGAAAIDSWYDAGLRRLPLPCTTRTLPTRFGATHVIVAGNPDGPPVMLLHGLGTNALFWKPQLSALAGFCIYAVDVVGQPGRSAAKGPYLTGGDHARWLAEVMDRLDVPRAAFAGISLGAFLTIKLGAYAPERVSRAVLLAPAGMARMPAGMFLRVGVAMLPLANYKERMRDVLQRTLMAPGVTVDDLNGDQRWVSEFLALLTTYEKPERHPLRLVDRAAPAFPLPARVMRRFRAPSLVLIGEHDAMFPARQVVKRARRLLPGLVDAAIIPDAGHGLTFDQTAETNTRMVAFLTAGA
jgi:pimeloyl-ACP methyl ester carboxylesterase